MYRRIEANMDVNHKKKSRTRNRLRNKCNRCEETKQQNILQISAALSIPNELSIDQSRVGQIKQNEENPSMHSLTALSNQTQCIPNKSILTSSEQTQQKKKLDSLKREPLHQPTAPKLDQQTAIYLIQGLLRKKLLAKNQAMSSSSSTNLVAPIKEQGQQKLNDNEKSEQMNRLLKSIGNKLQKGSSELSPGELFSKLGNMFSTVPLSESESSDEDAEYVEYIYKPRPYFLASLCNHCNVELGGRQSIPCKGCGLTYYCSVVHMREDEGHRQLCYGLRQLVDCNGHGIFYNSGDFSAEQFRSYRIVCIRQLENIINRSLTATEREVLLFPYICNHGNCREHRFKRLAACSECGEVAFCKEKPSHLSANHKEWCRAYRLFKAFVKFQSKFGRLEPPLPDEVLKVLPLTSVNTRQILQKLHYKITDDCEFAALTQISTGPLTAFYALKLCQRLVTKELTVHLIGAEMDFEVDVFQKWEIFLLHLLPEIKTLNIVFVGPELNPHNISFDQLKRIRCCRLCRKASRTVQYHFENRLYHNYCVDSCFLKPDLVCFFNSGLHRATGFALEDTWPDTIRASLSLKCPIVITSYTKYEAPLDMCNFLNQSNRHLNVVLPPTTNPFRSEKPERNFISDDNVPFMYKNYQCFVLE